MQHGSLRAPVRVFVAAVLLCLSFLAAPKAAAAQLQDVNGITLLSFDSQQIVSIGNQTSGRCSWYALRYARTILTGGRAPAAACGQTVRSGLRAATTVIPAACPSACRSFTPSFPPGSR